MENRFGDLSWTRVVQHLRYCGVFLFTTSSVLKLNNLLAKAVKKETTGNKTWM